MSKQRPDWGPGGSESSEGAGRVLGKQRGKGSPRGGVREEQPSGQGPGAAGVRGGPNPTQEASRPPSGCEGPREPPKGLKQGSALATAMLWNNLSRERME